MVYNVTSEYAPGNDSGVRWDSFGFDWEGAAPVMSERDRSFLLSLTSSALFDSLVNL